MALHWAIPLGAGILGGLFAATVWGRWVSSRRPAQLAWAVGLTFYALASLTDAIVASQGWTIPLYRAYFVLAAANVGFLGLGTILLTRPAGWTRAFAAGVIGASLLAALGQLSVPLALDTPVTIEGETRALGEWSTALGAKAIPFPNPARIAFLALNVVGGLALIGGAFLSWSQTRRHGVLLIGVGAMLPFLGGSISTLFALDLRSLLQLAGIAVMYAGFLRARPAAVPEPAPAAR